MNTTTIIARSSSLDIPAQQFGSLRAWGLDEYAHFSVPIQMLSDSWPLIWALIASYLALVWWYLHHPLPSKSTDSSWSWMPVDLSTARFTWNLGLALYSLLGSCHLLPHLVNQIQKNGLYATICEPNDSFYQGPVGYWFCLFVLGKVVELGDTILLLASARKIIFLHWFHHATVLPCSWYALETKNPMMPFGAAINYTIHAIMYAYFALNDTAIMNSSAPEVISVKLLWARRITTLQCAQFVLQLASIGIGGYDCIRYQNPYIPIASVVLSFTIITAYLTLFLDFAEKKYAYKTQALQSLIQFCCDYVAVVQIRKVDINVAKSNPKVPAWHRPDLTLDKRFQEATKMAAMLYGVATESDLLNLYGCYKQVKHGPLNSNEDVLEPPLTDSKAYAKYHAWKNVHDLSTEEAQETYIGILDKLHDRSQQVQSKTSNYSQKRSYISSHTITSPSSDSKALYPIKIAGHGTCLPRCVLTNADIEKIGGFTLSSLEQKRTGVAKRHFANIDNGENLIQNGANAIRAACQKAGVEVEDLDLIVGGFGGHQFLPDDAVLVQRELGLGESGIRAFTVHATCLSFLVAMEVAGSFMRDHTGKYQNVAVFASSISSVGVFPQDPHTAGLFGDGAAAIILQPCFESPQSSGDTTGTLPSGIYGVHMETYGCGAEYCRIQSGGTYRPHRHPEATDRMSYFEMNGPKTLAVVSKYARNAMRNFIPGLEQGLENLPLPMDPTGNRINIDWVVPHQASAVALDSLALCGWPDDKIIKTLHKYGNTVAASIPLTLCEGIESGKIQRGDNILLCGSSAGMSIASLLLTY